MKIYFTLNQNYIAIFDKVMTLNTTNLHKISIQVSLRNTLSQSSHQQFYSIIFSLCVKGISGVLQVTDSIYHSLKQNTFESLSII